MKYDPQFLIHSVRSLFNVKMCMVRIGLKGLVETAQMHKMAKMSEIENHLGQTLLYQPEFSLQYLSIK